jgi:Protein of unknown function (DUF429)
VRTLGVDLAAGSASTAACMISWDDGQAVVDKPIRPLDDEQLLGLLHELRPGDRAGVDCPFGWPVEFVRAIAAHASGQRWPGRGESSIQYRARMRLRLTDRRVVEVTGRTPLSVAFDKLGATAARWLIWQTRWRQAEGVLIEQVQGWWPRCIRLRRDAGGTCLCPDR